MRQGILVLFHGSDFNQYGSVARYCVICGFQLEACHSVEHCEGRG